jgi:hypothetical protein
MTRPWWAPVNQSITVLGICPSWSVGIQVNDTFVDLYVCIWC